VTTPTELRALVAAASPLPWTIQDEQQHLDDEEDHDHVVAADGAETAFVEHGESDKNHLVIVAAVNALPSLLDRIEALEAGLNDCAAELDGRYPNPMGSQLEAAARARKLLSDGK
jgi:hypothetical protein